MSKMELNGVVAETNSPTKDLSLQAHSEVVLINGRISDMNRKQLIICLNNSNLSTRGHDKILKKRLKDYYYLKKLPLSSLDMISEDYETYQYFVVVDFEATCYSINPEFFQHEIIEFPAVLVDTRELKIVDEFREYVKPTLNRTLSEFCTQLTGVTQEIVDNADEFKVVLKKFESWLKYHKLGKHNYAFVTDGPWDMKRFLATQCQISQIQFPHYAKKWVDLRKTYSKFYNTKFSKLSCMLEQSGLEFQGRLHCGIDDSRNIAALLMSMIKNRVKIKKNSSMNTYFKLKHTLNN